MSIAMTVAPATSEPASPRKYLDLPKGQALDYRQDSGYATQSSSLDGKSTEPTSVRDSYVSTQCSESTTIDNKARPVPLALTPVADLAEFDKSVDDDTLSRFRHLHAQIEKPLLAYICSRLPRQKYRPIALRLVVLGRSEDDAKPCIVVFCPEQQSKRVRKFFDKSSVRALCQPEDDITPSFDVFVLGRPVETKHGDDDVDVFISIMRESEVYTTETYCGAPIIIRQPSGVDRRCTFGGIIKTVSLDGDVKLYGLTVGHVLFGDSDDDLTVGTMSDGAEPLDDWEFQLSGTESEDELDDLAEEDLDGVEPLRAIESLQLAWEDAPDTSQSWASLEVGKIGCVSKVSMQSETATSNTNGEPKPFYDWALIDMESYKPNRIRARKLPNSVVKDGAFQPGDLVMPAMPPHNSGKRQPIVLLSGSEGPKRGSLSALPSRLLLGPGKAFVDTLVLNLDDNKQILDGDSGSWVVNEGTLEVYGYVVAVDAFGGGYVIPLREAFRNIANSLGLLSVDLATVVDMATVKLGREPDMTVKTADSLSIESSVVALVTFAFKSSTLLYTTVRDFQSQDKNVRALKNELADLRGVLESLAETVDNNSNISFDALKLPLLRCGKTCEEYGDLIARCMKHSSSSRPGFRDWISQQYLKGDITDFREMLAGYKSTINIALANANMRMVSSIMPDALEEYKDLIRDTTSDLQAHMTRLDERVRALSASEAESPVRDEPEWMAMVEEKQSTQEGLKICSQLSAQIEQLESASKEHPQFLQQPSAHKFIRSGLSTAKGSIQSLISRFQTHENDIDKRMEAMRSAVPFSGHEATQLAQLQETKESLRQCMSVVADAGETLTNERCNIFEDITMADSSYGIPVSTVKDLVVARRLNLSGQARHLGGQISDESYQRTIDGLTQLDLESVKSNGQGVEQTPSAHGLNNGGVGSHGFERYGCGFNLPSKP